MILSVFISIVYSRYADRVLLCVRVKGSRQKEKEKEKKPKAKM